MEAGWHCRRPYFNAYENCKRLPGSEPTRMDAVHWAAMSPQAVAIPLLAACISLPAPFAQAATANAYVNPAVCAQCHAEKARTYSQTGMGQSFYRMTAEKAVENFKSGLPFHHSASDTYFNVFERDGKYFQRRWQLGFDGRETNVEEKRIDFVLVGESCAHLPAPDCARHAPAVAARVVLREGRLLGGESGL